MHEKALRGLPWTVLSYAGGKGLSVISTIVLARLVAPADFGLIAIATLATNFLTWIAEIGFANTLVLRQDLDDRGKGTLLTLMAVSGVAAGAIAVALSPLVAAVFHAPRATSVLAVIALLLPLGSIAGFWEALLKREFEFRRRFLGLITQSIVAAVVSITLAALGLGVWALVVGQIAAMGALGIVLFAVAPYHVRPAFDRDVARSAFRTSRGFLGQGMAAYVRQNVDTVAVGTAFGSRRLGYYSMANRFGDVVYWTIAQPVANITFPSFARTRHAGGDVRPPFLRALAMVGLVSCPVGIIMSAAAEPFTRAVFGLRWLPMVGPLTIMGLWAAVRQMDQTIGWLLNSVGRAGAVGWSSLIILVPLVVGCVIATQVGGLTAVALVPLLDTLLSAGISSWLARRFVALSFRRQWRAVRPAVLASLPTWLITWGVGQLLGPRHAALGLVLAVVSGVAVYACSISLLEPGMLRQAATIIARTLGRAEATTASA